MDPSDQQVVNDCLATRGEKCRVVRSTVLLWLFPFLSWYHNTAEKIMYNMLQYLKKIPELVKSISYLVAQSHWLTDV